MSAISSGGEVNVSVHRSFFIASSFFEAVNTSMSSSGFLRPSAMAVYACCKECRPALFMRTRSVL